MRKCIKYLAQNSSSQGRRTISKNLVFARDLSSNYTYISPKASENTLRSHDDIPDEEDALHMRQLTANARTLVRAKRHDDASKVIDEGLKMFPWQPSLWFWKIATKVGDSKGAIEVWDTMTRMGVEKLAEHYDIMASAVMIADSRHVVVELFYEMLDSGLKGNPKFYATVFIACNDSSGKLLSDAEAIWERMRVTPMLAEIVRDPNVIQAYDRIRAAATARIVPEDTTPSLNPLATVEENVWGTSDRETNNVATPSTNTYVYGQDLPPSEMTEQSTIRVHSNTSELESSSEQLIASPLSTINTSSILNLDQVSNSTSVLGAASDQQGPADMRAQAAKNFEVIGGDMVPTIYAELEPFFRAARRNHRAHGEALTRVKSLLSNSPAPLHAYNYVIRSAAILESPEDLLALLEMTIEQGLRPDASTYNPIIRSFFLADKPDQALDLIDRMEVSQVRFDFRTILEVLRGLFRNNRSDAAMQFFVDVFKNGSDLSLIPGKDAEVNCFAAAVSGLCDTRRLEDAQKLIAVMVQRGLSPSLSIYNALVSGCFADGQIINAMKYFDMAIKTPDVARLNSNWKEDIDNLISTVVSGFLKSDRYVEAESFINKVAKDGYWNRSTSRPFVHFISWLGQHERIDDAWNVFEFQVTKYKGNRDQFNLYTAVLRAIYLERGDVFGGLKWFRTMQQHCKSITQLPYQLLIDSALTNRERDLGEQIWQEALTHTSRVGEDLSKGLREIGERWNLSG